MELHRGRAAAVVGRFNGFVVRRAAHQRGARPRRVRPLRVLRAHEDLRRRAARRAAHQREAHPRVLRPNVCGVDHHDQPQDQRHLPARRRPPALRRVVSDPRGRLCRRILAAPLALVRRRRLRPRRRLSRQPRPLAFNPKAPPPKTEAFWASSTPAGPEDAELADALDKLGNPVVTTLDEVSAPCTTGFHEWLHDRKNRRNIPHRFEACGYLLRCATPTPPGRPLEDQRAPSGRLRPPRPRPPDPHRACPRPRCKRVRSCRSSR